MFSKFHYFLTVARAEYNKAKLNSIPVAMSVLTESRSS